jgi:hypothetical protein
MKKLTPHERRVLAVAAEVDEKSIKRWEEGLPIRQLTRQRIERARKAQRAETRK